MPPEKEALDEVRTEQVVPWGRFMEGDFIVVVMVAVEW